ncbi:uncharacterized protein EV420DRAFT_1484253 [Desarmillaria tabescens]|uniref:Uncharacterized protein n=1 Tax=Armillaria tabescens TaxID=1929756 RepID=A0AA39MTM6_ARMTA|nr:uncharacterized protein EV420DRAFT_1484253 [Desarmillaria tabescens]KAK0445609.1 hypothetical protein EV420DRAFT_1484253 [Desarmillaria tabescens]
MALTDIERAQKTSIAGFARAGIKLSTIEKFDDECAKGREWYDVIGVYVTRSFSEMGDDELASLCLQKFSSTSNPYHPYFFIVLDERTEEDGSVSLHQQGENGSDRVSIRVSPATIPSLVVLLDEGMKDIPSIITNDYPEDEGEAGVWVFDAPLDFSDIQIKARMASSEFKRQSPGPDDDIESLKKSGIRLSEDYEAVNVELKWFGEAPETLLVQGFISGQQNRIFVTGASE